MMIRSYSTALTLLLTASFAFGHGGGGDIALYNDNGKTTVGFAELDDLDINQESFDPTVNVFQAVLLPLNQVPNVQPYEYGSTEPGYDANESVALEPGQFSSGLPSDAAVTWNMLEVQYWDGSGGVNFATSTGIDAGYVAPSSGMTDGLGGFHLHPVFGLVRSDDQPLDTGVYLAKLAITVDGLAESDPYYLVTLIDDYVNNQDGADADQIAIAQAAAGEEIGEAVRAYLAGDVDDPMAGGNSYAFYGEAIRYAESLAIPEPNACLLLVTALMFAASRNR